MMYTKTRRQNEITNYAKYMKNSESENYDKKSDKTQQRAIQQLNYAKQINIYPIKMRFVISLQLIHMRLGPNDMRHLVCVCGYCYCDEFVRLCALFDYSCVYSIFIYQSILMTFRILGSE